MRKRLLTIGRALLSALPFALILAAVLVTAFYPKGVQAEIQPRAVRIWHVDTFEGGKGSRATFLKEAAKIAEKSEEGLYYIVTAYTAEGARAALEKGESPDMLSFGVGLGDFLELAKPVSYRFAGGETDAGALAYPWCAGRYSLFCLEDNFEEQGETAISSGGSNLCELAAYLNGVAGEVLPSSSAYVGFLNGKYRYLLGTQRDECRFASRGVSVYRKELPAYCDLYQYIAVLNAQKNADCNKFLKVLLSDGVQGKLSSIGMFSLKETAARQTVSVFSSSEALLTLREALKSPDSKNIDKFLKKI